MTGKPAYADEHMLSIGEASELLGVHVDTVRRWADGGRLPVYRTPSNQRRFKVADLRAAVAPESAEPSEPNGGDKGAAA